MRTRNTPTRTVVVGALAATLAWSGAGTATAAPPSGGLRTVTDYATAVLRTGDDGVRVLASVVVERGAAPVADVDVYVQGYECSTDDTVTATIVELASATAIGVLDLTCTYLVDPENPPEEPVPDVTGTAYVDLEWAGTGEATRVRLHATTDHCVGRILERQAIVSGGVRVVVPELGVDALATTPADDQDSDLRYEAVVCPPPLNR
jgi:hypothetical protein